MVARVERPKRFCSACGATLAADARFCPACGVAVAEVAAGPVCIQCRAPASPDRMRADGMVDCPWCGGARAVSRPAGAAGGPHQAPAASNYSGALAFLCWFFLGGLGLHRFYLGYTTYGVVMAVVNIAGVLFTAGAWLFVVGLWWLVELILLPSALRGARER